MTSVSETTDALQPKAQAKEYRIGPEEEPFILSQKPLTFFGKMELFSILGGAIEKAMSDGLSIDDVLGAPGENLKEGADADLFIKGIVKLVKYAPEILLDLYAVILGFPRDQRDYYKAIIETYMDEQTGADILDTFIDQNWDAMVDFFKDRVMPLVAKVQDRVSPPSKPLKRTRQNTPKQ